MLDRALAKSIFLSKSNEKKVSMVTHAVISVYLHMALSTDPISSLLRALSAVYDGYTMSPRHTLYSMEFLRKRPVRRPRAYIHAPYGSLRLVLARVRQRQGTAHDTSMCGASCGCRGKPCDDTRSRLLSASL